MRTPRTALMALTALAALTACGMTAVTPAPSTTITLPGNAVFPEGVTYRAATDTFYVTSTTDGTIFQGKPGDAAATVAVPGSTGGTAVGLKVDTAGRLYVAGGASGKITVYDTTTSTPTLVRSYGTPAPASGTRFINDVALTAEGAYFTDSNQPVIFKVDRTAANGAGELTAWLDLTGTAITYTTGFNLNGIAATPDGKYLLTVQSNTGKLYRITVATKAVEEVALGGATLKNGDGILLDGQRLYVVRNADGVIVPVNLDSDFTIGTVGQGFTDPTFRYPTTVASTGNRLLVVNSQFDKQNGTPELPFTLSNVAKP
ncbi:SMP-30/gluconolactonase/LRE family protein [Deinococcus pimensis]|uniref:SMP-30/gluconolactonase/LRE family protein n=1 Tax=Deinococcus pimensis TaxID=309888 RepID=UPI0005EAF7BB|nr:SMP-30/gluconolactonase/LRE family protein [Deinococcus pimensis]